VKVEGLVFAGIASADPEGLARFLGDAFEVQVEQGDGFRMLRHFRAPDGRTFELLDRRV
jgi:hypothetical protein